MDWKKITRELIESGLTQTQIANEIGAQQPTIAYLLSGKQTRISYDTGHKLAQLHFFAVGAKPKTGGKRG